MSDADRSSGEGNGRAPVREQVQIGLILESVADVAPFPEDWDERATGVEYLYRKNTIVVRDSNLDSVRSSLDGRGVRNTVDDTVLAGATRLSVSKPADDAWSLHEELARIEGEEGHGAAGFDHLFYVCVHCCAAIEPEPVPADSVPVPRPQSGQDAASPASSHGKGVRLLVFDTGLVEGAEEHPWMAGVTGEDDTLVAAGAGTTPARIGQDGGHGTFVAGCVRVTAPEAKVNVVNAARLLTLTADADGIGAAFESDLAALLSSHLVAAGGDHPVRVPDVLVLNFAGTTQGGRPPVAMAGLYDSVIKHLKELLIVSPAGNEGDKRKTWPAAFPWVVSVGGLAENWRNRATWTNHGRNVDVYAPGDRLVNAFATGDYEPTWDGQQHNAVPFEGMALWSGTSFSTPLVAGLVAARMSTTGQSSRRAWQSLLDLAERQALPGVGPVLYPGQELA
ncbi:MAG: S8/S53 family peptidase [Nocardioides sp.]